jgi:hypothetical protein
MLFFVLLSRRDQHPPAPKRKRRFLKILEMDSAKVVPNALQPVPRTVRFVRPISKAEAEIEALALQGLPFRQRDQGNSTNV